MATNYDDAPETGYEQGRGVGYAPDRGPAGHGLLPPPEGMRPIASFSGTGPKMPRIPTSALEGSSFSAAQTSMDQRFAEATDPSRQQALRAMGHGPNEMGSRPIMTAQGPSIPSAHELLDHVAPGWRAAAAPPPEAPSFSGNGNGVGRPVFGRRGSGPAQEETGAAEEDAANREAEK